MSTNKKETGLTKPVSDDVAQQLSQGFPQEQGFTKMILPRLTLIATDKTEGRGKAMKVVQEAGVFLKEYQSEEVDENDKKIWAKDEIGTEIEGTIVFQRKQLKYFDQATEEFTSSTIFDSNEEVIPLFCNKAEVARDTVANLKAKYNYVDKDGKTKSRLEDNKILYVLYEGEIHQLALRGSSMYSCKTYLKTFAPPASPALVLTKFSSEPREKGDIQWSAMTFETVRKLNAKEAEVILNHQNAIRQAIAEEKAYFAQMNPQSEVSPKLPTQDEVNKFLKEKN